MCIGFLTVNTIGVLVLLLGGNAWLTGPWPLAIMSNIIFAYNRANHTLLRIPFGQLGRRT